MRQVLCPVLVGREEEAQVLLDALDRAAEGHGGTYFLTGEAGPVPVAFRPLTEAVLSGLRQREQLDLPELRPFRGAWPAGAGVAPD